MENIKPNHHCCRNKNQKCILKFRGREKMKIQLRCVKAWVFG